MSDIRERLRHGTMLLNYEALVELCNKAGDEIEHLRNTVVAADREIKASHADADRYRAEIARLRAVLVDLRERSVEEGIHHFVILIDAAADQHNTKPVEADNAAALKASDVRTTGRDASLSSAPTEYDP